MKEKWEKGEMRKVNRKGNWRKDGGGDHMGWSNSLAEGRQH